MFIKFFEFKLKIYISDGSFHNEINFSYFSYFFNI